ISTPSVTSHSSRIVLCRSFLLSELHGPHIAARLDDGSHRRSNVPQALRYHQRPTASSRCCPTTAIHACLGCQARFLQPVITLARDELSCVFHDHRSR